MMIDFTSSLYLGFRHASRSLRAWKQLTTGVPAALAEPPGAPAAAQRLAQLQGCESGLLASSTLHLFWELFGQLAGERVSVYIDAGTYPIAWWGVERSAARGSPAAAFAHRDSSALRGLLEKRPTGRRPVVVPTERPVVVTNGVCACCGQPAPLAEYLALVRSAGGLLVVDDTQALGLFGQSPRPGAPYGTGGGGTLRRLGLSGSDIVLISSLAKGFGVPAAALCGSQETLRRFAERSQTRVHCSPPSLVEIHALNSALARNERMGDALRLILAQRVTAFRRALKALGLTCSGGLFPVQVLHPHPDLDPLRLYPALLSRGIRCVPQRTAGGAQARISFVLTARTRPEEIEQAARALKEIMGSGEAARKQKQKEARDVAVNTIG